MDDSNAGPFVEPADASNDALWLQRASAGVPLAAPFFSNPIHRGKAWRAMAGLQAGTRLLVTGESDMAWPPGTTYGVAGSNVSASMKGQPPAGYHVPPRQGQPPQLVDVLLGLDDKSRTFCWALDADGGVWVRGNYPNDHKYPGNTELDYSISKIPFPGLVRLPLPFRATTMAKGGMFIDDSGVLWYMDDWTCHVTRCNYTQGGYPVSIRVAEIDGDIILTTSGEIKHISKEHIGAMCAIREYYYDEYRKVESYNEANQQSDPSSTNGGKTKPYPPKPPRCMHGPEVTTADVDVSDVPPVPGTAPGGTRVISIAAVSGDSLREKGCVLVLALTSAGELWATWSTGSGSWNHWEFLPAFSLPHSTKVTAMGWASLKRHVRFAVYVGDGPGVDGRVRFGELNGASQITKLGKGKNIGAKIKSETFPVFDSVEVAQVALGRDHTALLTQAGEVYTWGRNKSGELGLGETHAFKAVKSPTKVPLKADQYTDTPPFVISVAVGKETTAAIAFPPLPSHLRGPPGPTSVAATTRADNRDIPTPTSCCQVM